MSLLYARLGLIVAGAVAVLTVLLGARQAGRHAERVAVQRQTLEVIRAQREAGARAPADRAALVERLRDGDF